ncbi:MAG TPA: hypothetical protein VEU28_11430 [Actinomycetota bacterium]|nr:hypothetical protein [Actinomycetota bacterium]
MQGAAEKVSIPGKLVQVSGTGPRFDEEAPCTMQEIALANLGRDGMVALYLRDPLSGCTLSLIESGNEIPGLGPDAVSMIRVTARPSLWRAPVAKSARARVIKDFTDSPSNSVTAGTK